MKIEDFTLANGVRCVLQRSRSHVAFMGLTVGVGTRNEQEKEHGVAHLIEHLLFKGTQKRKAYHINSLLENVGGELNAYTTKEETVVHATVLKGDIVRGVELIGDVVFNSIFPEAEIVKERNVIIDEINSYKDSPSELIYDDFEDLLFRGCSLGRNILGSRQSLKKIGRNEMIVFRDREYTTDRMVFSMVANLSFARFKAICERYIGCFEPTQYTGEVPQLPEYTPEKIIRNKGTYQAHCIIGGRSYNNSDKKRVALALLINILGGPSASSRLNTVLREKHGLSYSVEAAQTAYSDTGVASVYFSTEKENLDKCTALVFEELRRVREEPLSSLQLARAKKQFIGQLFISSDSSESMMLSAGKSMLVYDKIDSIEALKDKIMAVSSEELLEVSDEVFCLQNLTTLIYR